MMKRFFITAVCIAAGLVFSASLHAQYYSTGQTPAGQRWMSVKSDSLRMVFPREFQDGARRAMFYMDYARPYIGYGFDLGPMKTPVVFKTENFYSNGMAMLTPKRIEMVSVPAADNYAEPWLKQLSVHEYRHMVQYNNVNRNTVKVLSYVLGQQVSLVATGLLPFWFIEGDAVMAETQMSEFGRGLQPSFTMHYRALGREILGSKNPDKWFCGSYKDYVPSHYELGYQLVARSQEKYGKYIWNDIAEYSSKYPFLIFTTQLGLNKFYGTSTKKLFRETFEHLNDFWDAHPHEEFGRRRILAQPDGHTTYSHPLFIDDNTVVALKTDLHKPSRFVRIDLATGKEEHMAYTGQVSTRPAYDPSAGKLYWTEYRQSALWEQKTDSRLVSMDMADGKKESGKAGNILYPTPAGNSFCYVRYDYSGNYSIEGTTPSYRFADGTSVHGLAYDEKTDALYYIALADKGMWIGSIDLKSGTVSNITSPSRVTVSDLRAGGGKLYFGSIASGLDEAHMIDLADGREYRLTGSEFGSFAPAPAPDGSKIVLTEYGRRGYIAAVQDTGEKIETKPARLPDNTVNPATTDWGLPKMGDMVFTETGPGESKAERPAKRYRRLPHMFNVHSWAPVYYEPDNIINNYDFNIHFGATLVSQSLLGDAESSLGYGYTSGGNSLVRAKVSYLGSAPKFEVSATWSNSGQAISKPDYAPMPEKTKDYFYLTARAYQPILLSNDYCIRWLTPSIQYTFRNSLTWTEADMRYIRNDSYAIASLQYSSNVRRAALDLQPRWGYTIRGGMAFRPADSRFTQTWFVTGRVYTPGVVRHHGLSVAASYTGVADKEKYSYTVVSLVPRGYTSVVTKKFAGASINYRMPLAYPDAGISGVVFLKRIWLTAGFDFASYIADTDPNLSLSSAGTHIWSWGGTLNFDIVPFRLPSQGTCTLSVSCYVPRSGKPFVSAGFSVPL